MTDGATRGSGAPAVVTKLIEEGARPAVEGREVVEDNAIEGPMKGAGVGQGAGGLGTVDVDERTVISRARGAVHPGHASREVPANGEEQEADHAIILPGGDGEGAAGASAEVDPGFRPGSGYMRRGEGGTYEEIIPGPGEPSQRSAALVKASADRRADRGR